MNTYEEAIEKIRLAESEIEWEYSMDYAVAFDLAIEVLKERHEQEQTFEWCHDCKEYDQEAHCCHRWSKVIRTTIADIRAGMANDILEQIDKLKEKEPLYYMPNQEAYMLFEKIVTDWRDHKGAWASRERKEEG